jgi:hypothetical protein
MNYDSVTLRAPTSADILKATAIRGQSPLDTTLRLIEGVSGEHVPYDALKTLPAWLVMQMGEYMDEFMGSPGPDPLVAWRAARRAAAEAEVAAEAAAKAAEPSDTAPA